LVVRRIEADVIKSPAFAPSGFEVARTVRDAIAYDPRISAADVHPLVSGGFVLLRGTVRSNLAKQAAEAAARNTVGALGVTNQLKVLPYPGWSDADTQARAQLALRQDVYTRALPVSVAVTASKATLEGSAQSAFQRGHATRLIASIEGVRDVDNQVVVSHPAAASPINGIRGGKESFLEGAEQLREDADIAGAISRCLLDGMRGAEVSAQLDRGVATLNGIVQTTSERVSATLCAYEAGAIFVDNRIRVRGLD
jgi:osmotically-inducible protein OsmY